jgi:gliding motility-associated-like protein
VLPSVLSQRQKRRFLLLVVFFFLIVAQQASAQYISTFAGNGVNGYTGDGGPAMQAGLPFPFSICFDPAGDLYVTCYNSIRKIDRQTGIITRFAGNGDYTTTGDGGPAISASLMSAGAVCSDKAGNIYIADYTHSRIRKVDPSGTITTIAGNGTAGFSGDGGSAVNATLNTPWSMATDAAGNLYFADGKNYRIRKIDAVSGIITTVAGTGAEDYSGDGGPALSAAIATITGLFVHKNGDIYLAEAHHTYSGHVRKIDAATGNITTVAGSGNIGYTADGVPALQTNLFSATSVVLDDANNIYITTHEDGRIRKVDAATGIISTFAGTGFNGFNGENGPATTTRLNQPRGLVFDSEGNLFVADHYNLRLRKISETPLCTPPTISISTPTPLYCYNSSSSFTASISGEGSTVSYQWKLNGVNVGSNSAAENIMAGVNDVVTCELTTTNSCNNIVTVVSNSVTILSNPGYNKGPEVTIAASQETICAGTLVTFTATNVSESATPVYQWLINGNPASVLGPVFSTTNLAHGDKVECIMTVPHCFGGGSTKDYSNAITMTVNTQQNPTVGITPIAVSICEGIPVTFTAKAENAGPNPVYQWKVNNLTVGTNSYTFTSTTFRDNDQVTCEVTMDPAAGACTNGTKAVSNSVTLAVSDGYSPSLVITASDLEICQGTLVTFTAVGTDTGPRPTYQWQVNGQNTGTNNPVFSANNLANGDKVSCTLTPASSCSSVATSNELTVIVHPNPDVRFATPSVVVEPGKQIQLTPLVQGTIASHQWTPANMLVNPASLTPTTVPLSTVTTFTLLVRTAAGCEDTASFTVTAYNKLYMPNSFTPNGDGKNDLFRIPSGAPITLKEFSVYDRWGGLVFTTTDRSKGWDGKQKGTNATAGTYVYLVRAEDANGEVLLKGTVLLIR